MPKNGRCARPPPPPHPREATSPGWQGGRDSHIISLPVCPKRIPVLHPRLWGLPTPVGTYLGSHPISPRAACSRGTPLQWPPACGPERCSQGDCSVNKQLDKKGAGRGAATGASMTLHPAGVLAMPATPLRLVGVLCRCQPHSHRPLPAQGASRADARRLAVAWTASRAGRAHWGGGALPPRPKPPPPRNSGRYSPGAPGARGRHIKGRKS